MADYLYHIGKLYLNQQKKILNNIKEENLLKDKSEEIIKKIEIEHSKKIKVVNILEKNINKQQLILNDFETTNLKYILESDSDVETSEEK